MDYCQGCWDWGCDLNECSMPKGAEISTPERQNVDPEWATCSWCGHSVQVLSEPFRRYAPHDTDGGTSGPYCVNSGARIDERLIQAQPLDNTELLYIQGSIAESLHRKPNI